MSSPAARRVTNCLIVVAIILIIAGIAVPSLLKAKVSANNSAAASTLRTIDSAEMQFNSSQNPSAYGSLADLATANLVDDKLGTGTRSGYNFTATGDTNGFVTTAKPVVPSSTAVTYCSDDTLVVRVGLGCVAGGVGSTGQVVGN
jgi:type II secretory pathway pseudopilin PulG